MCAYRLLVPKSECPSSEQADLLVRGLQVRNCEGAVSLCGGKIRVPQCPLQGECIPTPAKIVGGLGLGNVDARIFGITGGQIAVMMKVREWPRAALQLGREIVLTQMIDARWWQKHI